jgi:hypothetical protein
MRRPLQNRVDPYGQLHAVEARGFWMGNRGVLHNSAKEIVASWRLTRWITCALSFKGIRRDVFAPNRYSELFFLDEATSLAAGHRPCAECRRSRFEELCAAWRAAGNDQDARWPLRADDIDRVLHSERVKGGPAKRTFSATLSSLPAGTIVDLAGRPYLYWAGLLRPWSFSGYGAARDSVGSSTHVKVLTPRSIVRAIRVGFAPRVHESAGEISRPVAKILLSGGGMMQHKPKKRNRSGRASRATRESVRDLSPKTLAAGQVRGGTPDKTEAGNENIHRVKC